VKYFQVFGGPERSRNDRFDISAKAEPEVVAKAGMVALLRQLLEERFTLKAHREMRELPVYSRVMAGKTAHLRIVPEKDLLPVPLRRLPQTAKHGLQQAATSGVAPREASRPLMGGVSRSGDSPTCLRVR
jgi:uncharacterized protein (TIGR03435 family)